MTSYGHFKNTGYAVTQYKVSDLDNPMNEHDAFYLNLIDCDLRNRLARYFPNGFPVLLYNDNPSMFERGDGSLYWLLDSELLDARQITMLTSVYEETSIKAFANRWTMPDGTQYIRNRIKEVPNAPLCLHVRDFGINVNLIHQTESWQIQAANSPEVLPAAKKTTTRKTTTRKSAPTSQLNSDFQ